jgi:hypothetical protein
MDIDIFSSTKVFSDHNSIMTDGSVEETPEVPS